MKPIRAFVGHSFTDDDSEVVGKFLDFFQSVAAGGNFMWEHAQVAEPKLLADKVLSLIADKNVFIAICTRKERVIKDRDLRDTFFSKTTVRAEKKSFEWKTSDWILQEIGLAVGKGLSLILLVEDGLRDVGGMQGNIEYIPFNRTAPEKSYKKIVEMINALTPRASEPGVAAVDAVQTPAKEQANIQDQEGDEWLVPRPQWTLEDYKRSYFAAVVLGNDKSAKTIFDTYLTTPDAQIDDHTHSWKASAEFTRLIHGKGGDIENLKKYVQEAPDSGHTLATLGHALAHYHDYNKAAPTFQLAAAKISNATQKLKLLGLAAINFAEAKKTAEVITTIGQMKTLVQQYDLGEAPLLTELIEIAKAMNEIYVPLALMERKLELDPSDMDTRFSLAYDYSARASNDLSLFHYLEIPADNRSSSTWNNLGVAFDRLSLPAKSVVAYREAEANNFTLAMSNLAQKLLSVGFLPEAKALCERAIKIEGYDKRVGNALASIQQTPDDEDEKQTELIEKSRPTREFLRDFGRATALISTVAITTRWAGPDCTLTMQINGSTFSVTGTYEKELSAGLGALMTPHLAAFKQKSKAKYQISYSGNVRGNAFDGEVVRKQEDDPNYSFGLMGIYSGGTKTHALLILSDDGMQMRAMENPDSTSVSFHTWTRIAKDG